MLKKFYFMASLLLTGTIAVAQPEPGTFSITPRIGITATTLTDDASLTIPFMWHRDTPSDTYVSYGSGLNSAYSTRQLNETEYQMALAGAVDLQWNYNERWSFVSGIGYSMQGCKYKTDSYQPKATNEIIKDGTWDTKDVKMNLHYLSVPVMAKFYVGHGFALNAGLQFDWLLQSYLKSHLGYYCEYMDTYYFAYVSESWKQSVFGGVHERNMKNKVDDSFYRFALSLPVGFSYEYKRYVADMRANIGLSDISDNKGAARNLGFMFTLGYRFDFKIQ